ncbi:MAG: hypothetical protein KJ571_18825 [Bacteroidetes bacterium]|nr:hypothetical protein [Bacteroidota bacterium]
MEENNYINQNYNLIRLKKYLNYEVSGLVLFILSFQVFIFIFLASAAVLIFTPFMLYVLYTEKKKGWLILFIIIVFIPLMVLIVSFIFIEFSRPMLFISIGLFYFYFFLLRFDVNEWVREAGAKNQYLRDKKKRELELKSFTDNFN